MRDLDEIIDDILEYLDKTQFMLAFNDTEYAKYIGVHRTWLVNFRNRNLPHSKLARKTIALLNQRVRMPFELMEEYNMVIAQNKIKNKK